MTKSLALFLLVCLGCKDPRSLTKPELEAQLREHAHFDRVELELKGEHHFVGTATEPSGLVYDLEVQLTSDYVSWKAVTRPLPISKQRLEELISKWLSVSELALEQKSPDEWEGKGKMNGREVELNVRIEKGQITITSKTDKGGPYIIQTNTDERRTRGGGFKP